MPAIAPEIVSALVEFPLVCPKCGCTECHIEGVRVRQNDQLTRVSRRGARTSSVPPRGRGSTVYVDLLCELGCLFSASYTFHKGTVMVEMLDRGTFDAGGPPAGLWRS